MKNQPFHRRLRYAFSGIRSTSRTEASFRTQLIFAAGAIVLLLAIRPRPVWWALFMISIAGVLAAELVNTALEHLADRLHPEKHPSIAMAKDCAAGAVLILSLASLAVAAALICDWLAGTAYFK